MQNTKHHFFNLIRVCILIVGIALFTACMAQTTTQAPTNTPETPISIEPSATPSPTIQNTNTPLLATLTPTSGIPTRTATLTPTTQPTPKDPPNLTVNFTSGDCAAVPHPFIASKEPDTNNYTITNPLDQSSCTFQLTVDDPDWDGLDVEAYTPDGLWLTVTTVAETNGERWYEFDVVLYVVGVKVQEKSGFRLEFK